MSVARGPLSIVRRIPLVPKRFAYVQTEGLFLTGEPPMSTSDTGWRSQCLSNLRYGQEIIYVGSKKAYEKR